LHDDGDSRARMRYDSLKRGFEAVAAGILLLVLSPLLAAVALAVRRSGPGPILFRQGRVGLRGKPFDILKFRTMRTSPDAGPLITSAGDPRVTRVGRVLRRWKLDELPQLVNVLRGEMSFVGPRPEVPRYVDMFAEAYQELLAVRPGITDLASLTRDSSAQARVEPRLRAAAKPRPGCSSHRAHGGGDSRMARAERADGADGERSRSSRGAALMGVSPRVRSLR